MGFRTHEEEGAMDAISLDEFLIENKEAAFLIRAESDSMRDSGIFRGDLLVVDRSRSPRTGDIVIAAIDGSFMMKYFDDLPRRDLKVEAVVTAVIRKLI